MEIVEMMKSQGWVSRPEFCEIAETPDSGSLVTNAKSKGVRCVMVNTSGTGRETWMFRPEDAPKMTKRDVVDPVGGKHNFGKVLKKIANIEARLNELDMRSQRDCGRLVQLESFKKKFD